MSVSSPVLVIGNLNVDLILGSIAEWPSPGTEIFLPKSDFRAGGSAGNTAIVLRWLGRRAKLATATGNDALGQWLYDRVGEEDDLIPFLEHSTSLSVGILHELGDRTFFSNQGHLDHLCLDHLEPALSSKKTPPAAALLAGAFTTPKLATQYLPLIERLQQNKTPIAIDPGWPSSGWTPDTKQQVQAWFKRCDHILINDKEALGLTNAGDVAEALQQMSRWMPPSASIIVKQGVKGAAGCENGRTLSAQAPSGCEIFDTVGAGDAFNAGYLNALASGQKLQARLEAAVKTASTYISHFPRLN